MEKEKKKKDEESTSIKVNQPIWRSTLQRISRNLPPEQQFRLSIFKLSKLKMSPSQQTPYVNLSTHKLAVGIKCRMCIIILPWWRSSQNFQSEPDSAQVESNCYHPEIVLLWTSFAFQSKHLFKKLNLRLTHSSLIKKIIYMRENGLPPKYRS